MNSSNSMQMNLQCQPSQKDKCSQITHNKIERHPGKKLDQNPQKVRKKAILKSRHISKKRLTKLKCLTRTTFLSLLESKVFILYLLNLSLLDENQNHASQNHDEPVPLLFVDVNLGGEGTERIV